MALQAPGYGQPRVTRAPDAAPLQSAEASAAAFGGGPALAEQARSAGVITRGISEVAQKAADVAAAQRDAADHAIVLDRNLKAEQLKNDLTTQAKTFKGLDAINNQAPLETKLGDGLSAMSMDLTPRQRAMFTPLAEAHSIDFRKTVQEHGVTEAHDFSEKSSKATIDNFKVDAWRHPYEPARIDESKQLALHEMDYNLAQNGIHPDGPTLELYANKRLELTSDLHTGVIDQRLRDGNAQAAINYFQKNFNEIDPRKHKDIGEGLKEGKLRADSQAVVDRLLSRFDSLAAAQPSIDAMKDKPELRDAVQKRAEDQYSIRSKMAGQATDAAMLKWADRVYQTGSLDTVDPIALRAMSGPQQDALAAAAKQARSGFAIQDPQVFTKYDAMAPGQLAKVTPSEMLLQVRPFLTPDQYTPLEKRWTDSRDTTSPTSKVKAQSAFSDRELYLLGLQQYKQIPNTETLGSLHKNEEYSAKYKMFSEKADNAIIAFTRDHGGKEPDGEAKKKIISDLLKPTITVGANYWFQASQKEVPLNTATPDEKANVVIPPSSVSAMQGRAARLGNPKLTKDQMQRAYASALDHDDASVDRILSGQ